MRLRRSERDQRAFPPNQVVAQRIALARELRGWTQEEAADRLERFLGAKWSPATFSIVERSVDGKRIRQFTADELVALSRAFEVPIGWWFTPSWGDSSAVIVTPDAPDGLPSQLMVDVDMGDVDGFETWANELLMWASNQRVIVGTATGKIVRQAVSRPAPNHGSTTSLGSGLRWPSPNILATSTLLEKALLKCSGYLSTCP